MNEIGGLVLNGLGQIAQTGWDIGSFVIPKLVKGGIETGRWAIPHLANGSVALAKGLGNGVVGGLMLAKDAKDDLANYIKDLDKVVTYVPDNKNGGVKPVRKRDQIIKNKVLYTPKELRSEQELLSLLNSKLLSEAEAPKDLKEPVEKLTKHYAKKENRTKFLSSLENKMKKHQQWIKKLENKLSPEVYNSLHSNADLKVNQLKSSGEKYSFTQLFNDAIDWINETFYPSEKKKGRVLHRLAIVALDAIVCYINLVMMTLFSSFLGAKLGLCLGSIIVAPITEEIYKYFTIKLKEREFGWVYFNVGEWFQYIAMTGSFNLMGIPYMIVRFLVTFMHMITTKVQSDPEIGPKKDRFKLASFIHFMWNGPIAFVADIVKSTSAQFLGMWSVGITSIVYFIGVIKVILQSINKLKSFKKEEEPEPGLVPQPA